MVDRNIFRKTGLDFLGDLPWGTHLCQFYHQKEDLLECLVPFFRTGLEGNEYCLWITTGIVTVHQAYEILDEKIQEFGRYKKKGQVDVVSAEEWSLAERLPAALDKKFDGVRGVAGIHRIAAGRWKSVLDYEEQAQIEFPKINILALCTYSLANCPLRNIPKLIERHHKTFLKKGWRWEMVTGMI